MALIDWDYLDQQYNKTVDALVSDRREQRTRRHKEPSPLERFEAWIATHSTVPAEIYDVLEVFKELTAPGLQEIMRFSTELFSRWLDVRQEVQDLQRHNAKLVAERHRYRESAWKSDKLSEADAVLLKTVAAQASMGSEYKEMLQNLTRNVNAFRLAREQFGAEHPETIAAFESMEHANAEAVKELAVGSNKAIRS